MGNDSDRRIAGQRISPGEARVDDILTEEEQEGPEDQDVIDSIGPTGEEAAQFMNIAEEIRDKIEPVAEESRQRLEDLQEFDILSYPEGLEPSDVSFIGEEEVVGIMTTGVNTVDFTRGDVDFGGGLKRDLSADLQSLDADRVKNISIRADDLIFWFLPELNVGNILKQARVAKLELGRFDVTGVTELAIGAPRFCEVEIVASTQNDLAFDIDITKGVQNRISYDPRTRDRFIEIDSRNYEDNVVTFAPETASLQGLPTASQTVYGQTVDNYGMTIRNEGESDVDFIIEVSDSIAPVPDVDEELDDIGAGVARPLEAAGFSELAGWTRSSPVTVEADSGRSLELSPWNHTQWRMLARNQDPNEENEVFVNLAGRMA